MVLLDECRKCNTFRWSGEYFKQVRGLAIGYSSAPALAVAFMSKVEKPVIKRKPILYFDLYEAGKEKHAQYQAKKAQKSSEAEKEAEGVKVENKE
ncbi:hypothetical protein GCK32_002482 [Trichostrongylus colubriformis]|uniref:Uncharacterized protein n=1 Tax=Trichostrongylus colubriformis TaxID=6319 RepID=A0AAN8F949_TRICO